MVPGILVDAGRIIKDNQPESTALKGAPEHMSKNLIIRAQNVTQEIFDILGVRPSGPQGDKVSQAIEQVIVKALNKSVERSTDVAEQVIAKSIERSTGANLAADRGLADRVAEEIRTANKALIVNLSAMR